MHEFLFYFFYWQLQDWGNHRILCKSAATDSRYPAWVPKDFGGVATSKTEASTIKILISCFFGGNFIPFYHFYHFPFCIYILYILCMYIYSYIVGDFDWMTLDEEGLSFFSIAQMLSTTTTTHTANATATTKYVKILVIITIFTTTTISAATATATSIH